MRRQSWLTFVVVGAGPTGVEMAGQIAELAHDALRRDFRSVDTSTGARPARRGRATASWPASPSRSRGRRPRVAREGSASTPLARHTVVDVHGRSVAIESRDGDTRASSPPAPRSGPRASRHRASRAKLAGEAGIDVDRAGRVSVEPDLTLPGHPEVFALGDMVHVGSRATAERPLPGLAPVAMQQGRYAARLVRGAPARPRPTPRFGYVDKGNLATIGRSKAVADVKGLHLSGFPAWAMWLLVHLVYLIGFQNRLLVLLRWTISFVTRGRGARLIVPPPTASTRLTVRNGNGHGRAIPGRASSGFPSSR